MSFLFKKADNNHWNVVEKGNDSNVYLIAGTENMNYSGVFWINETDPVIYLVGEELQSESNQRNQFVYRYQVLEGELLPTVSIVNNHG